MSIPRIIIAGTSSGVGKTIIATGIMSALAARGYRVQPFKTGPDYIDPGYHTFVTGRVSKNLDTWLLSDDCILELFRRSAAGSDNSVVEGVMGFYDGHSGLDDRGSTAYLSRLLQAPVILIVDIAKMAGSAAAIVLGYKKLDPRVNLAGVILNRGAGETHCRWAREAVEKYAGVPVIGCIKRDSNLVLPERHLGLVPKVEKRYREDFFQGLRETIDKQVDLQKLASIACSAPILPKAENKIFNYKCEVQCRLGVAQDEAFHFYYQDGMDLLSTYGVEQVYFSPLANEKLPPDLDGLYIGGGFPELFASDLEKNSSLRRAIKEAAAEEMPIYAECGGLMYLAEKLVDFEGRSYKMVGVIPACVKMTRSLQGMGYYWAKALQDNILMQKGQKVRGHLFHWSKLEDLRDDTRVLSLQRENGRGLRPDGIKIKNVLASYLHLHFCSHPEVANNFVNQMIAWRKRRKA